MVGQFAQHIALGQHRVCDRLDRAVAPWVGLEIDRAVLRKIDLAALALRTQELSVMVAASHRDGVEAKRPELVRRGGDTALGQVPSIAIDGLVLHECLFPLPGWISV